MRKFVALIALAVAVILAAPAVADEESYKCSAEAQACLNHMAAKFQNRGWAGVEMEHNSEGKPYVTTVIAGTPADNARVKVGDVLLAINGITIQEENWDKLQALEGDMKPGAKFHYTIQRNGKEREIALTLAEMPEAAVARVIGAHMLQQHATTEIAAN